MAAPAAPFAVTGGVAVVGAGMAASRGSVAFAMGASAPLVHAVFLAFWEGATVVPVVANGRAAALLLRDGVPYAFVTVAASQVGVDDVMWILNPAKLRAIASSITAPRLSG